MHAGSLAQSERGPHLRLLWDDGEIALFRGIREQSPQGVLHAVIAGEHPTRQSVERLTHEYELKNELEPEWAAVPIELVREHARTVLVLADPGGEPLGHFAGHLPDRGAFLRLALSITRALEGVHRRGLIHKNLKPAHILADAMSGKVWLTGFGVATRLPREHAYPEAQHPPAGTLAYMAPEQTGRMNRSIDARSDLYALGVTLYQILTGVLPFSATDPAELVYSHIARQPTPASTHIPDLPEAISAIVMKLLAKSAAERYQTAAGLRADLTRCLEEWQATGNIGPFALGASDSTDVLRIPEELYGRESQVDALLGAFERVRSEGTLELILITGYSGIGKSSVVNELHRAMPPRSLFVSGKFDQYRRDIPYAPLASGFRTLMRRILSMSEPEVHEWRTALQEALGTNGLLLVDLIPELELLIGPQPPIVTLPPRDAQNRFQFVFRRFLGVFARPEHPLVLFLDDLQWLDAASLSLLEHLISEPDVRHLLVIGAYRDNEVTAEHPLALTLNVLRKAEARVHDIVLTALSVADMRAWVAAALRCEHAIGAPLAQLLHEKTAGNPFFAIQFLTELWAERLLTFDTPQGRWTWDLDRIRAKRYTDNVVDLLVAKLNRLPAITRGALRQLACLGDVATTATLSVVRLEAEHATHAALWDALHAGLVFHRDGTYRFLHDRVQEAAYSLIPEADRAAAHLQIGRVLLSRIGPAELPARLFEIVNQLNRGATLITSQAERDRLAELNLEAAKRAGAGTAAAAALHFVTLGRTLLAPECWERQYRLVFELEFNGAQCEYLMGLLPAAEARLAMLAQRAANLVDAAAVACAQIALYMMLDRSQAALDVALDYLRKRGIEWTAHPSAADVSAELDCLWEQMGDRSIEELIDLPIMTDPLWQATLDVLMWAQAPATWTDKQLRRLMAVRMANISLQYGNSDASCVAYAGGLAAILGAELGEYASGYRFAKLGFDLLEKHGLHRFRALVHMGFGYQNSLNIHLRSGLDMIRGAFALAQESGNLTHACYACSSLVSLLIGSGAPLEEVEREAKSARAFSRKAGMGLLTDIATAQLRLVRALRGLTPEVASLNGDEFDEAAFEARLPGARHSLMANGWYWLRKLQARCYGGEEAAAVMVADTEVLQWTFEATEHHFFAGLAQAAYYRTAPASQRAQLSEALDRHVVQLDRLAQSCPKNYAGRAALLAAEIARIRGRDVEAMQLYERSIQRARDSGFVHDEALANELAGRCHLARGLETAAYAYLHAAHSCYRLWGADGKVRQLARLYPRLTEPSRASQQASNASVVQQLDIRTVVRAFQAVSGEILLPKLVETLMKIALQSAGADRGLLILPLAEAYRIEAEARTSADSVEVLTTTTTMTTANCPEMLIRYVVRTHESVILDDGSQPGLFGEDEYFRHSRPRSILCLPLMRQNRLRGALYLENSLTTHAFTPDRVALLELVAAQAAISLENTHLYSELEERESRIRRLVDSNVIGIFFWDLSGSISEANDACLALIGYSREDLKAGAIDWKNITPPEYWAGDERATEELHETGSCTPYEKEYIRKDGRRTRVLIGATFLSRSRHEGVAFVVDLAERQRAEVEREARRVAEAANIAKTRFLAHMSHELRTPLNGILGYAQLLQRDPSLDAGQLARVDTIAHSGEHLLALINDLLDVAKIEAGKLELLTAETMLPDLLRTIVEIAEVQANQRGLTFVFEVTPDIPAAVLVDERRLRQVLLNLLANAIRFTDAGRVVLRVARTGAERVRFEVQDTGVGIPIERQDSVFQPFGPDGERTRSRGGTGLGLAISGEIVRRMGGDIQLESRPGKGSRFWFELDLQPAQTSAPLQEQHVPVRYAGEPRKVLVVDDVMVNRALLVEGLSSVGLQVFAAASGLECLAMAESLRPDLIVMDLVMPGIGGLETIRRLRNTGRFENVPIIATSANASPQDAKDSAAAGANAFFPKPTQLVELLREIGALLQLSWVNDVHPESRADGAPLVAPPAPEMDVLYRLACEGDMKAISHAAARVAEIDEHYSAFSDRLRALASSYQTKAVLAFVEQFRNETK